MLGDVRQVGAIVTAVGHGDLDVAAVDAGGGQLRPDLADLVFERGALGEARVVAEGEVVHAGQQLQHAGPLQRLLAQGPDALLRLQRGRRRQLAQQRRVTQRVQSRQLHPGAAHSLPRLRTLAASLS